MSNKNNHFRIAPWKSLSWQRGPGRGQSMWPRHTHNYQEKHNLHNLHSSFTSPPTIPPAAAGEQRAGPEWGQEAGQKDQDEYNPCNLVILIIYIIYIIYTDLHGSTKDLERIYRRSTKDLQRIYKVSTKDLHRSTRNLH